MIYSGAWEKLIHEKNLKSKISCHCPFKRRKVVAACFFNHPYLFLIVFFSVLLSRKNNLAAKKSRDARRVRENQLRLRVLCLENANRQED
jgi:hypothetical protein